jgi:dehydrogenase/reductase SDR family member 12
VIALADRLIDATVVPGYTSLGYRMRGLSWASAVAGDLDGADVLVTGASSGLGEATCEGLARAGARVHMLVRNPGRGEAARERVAAKLGSSDRLELQRCDLADLAAVRSFAESFAARVPRLAVLVNNAGVLTQERERSPDGHELTFATNVLGPFALTASLLGPLRAAGHARVINVTSGGMFTARLDATDPQLERREFSGPNFYAHTKRAEMALTTEWAERLRDEGIVVHAMHPGWADTPGLADSLPRFRRVMRPLLRDAPAGADTIVWLATAREPGECTGKLWHDRRPRAAHRVPFGHESPADRGRLWNECARLAGVSL